MKRTLFVLTTVATLILMSCNHIDNSIASAEDVNLPQTQTLQKEATVGITPYGYGSVASSYFTMSISASAGATASSTLGTANFPGVTGKITGVECCLGSSSGTGTITPQSMKIWLGGKTATPSITGSCAKTTAFNGLDVPTSCSVNFTGKCTSSTSCTRSYAYNYCTISYDD